MNRSLTAAVATTALLAPAGTAAADHVAGHAPPGGNNATTISALDATPNPLVFGTATTLDGRLSGAARQGTTVRLEADDTRPYGDAYRQVATASSDQSGHFAFTLKPLLNTQYRAVAQASPPVTSAARLVLVRTRVGLVVSDRTPRAGSLVPPSGEGSTRRFASVERWTSVSCGSGGASVMAAPEQAASDAPRSRVKT